MIKEILIGASLGTALGFWWQTYHWNEVKKVGAAWCTRGLVSSAAWVCLALQQRLAACNPWGAVTHTCDAGPLLHNVQWDNFYAAQALKAKGA